MNAPARLGLFAVAAVVALGGGAALGAVAGPEPDTDPPTHDHQESPMSPTTLAHAGHGSTTLDAADFRLDVDSSVVAPGSPAELTFQVVGSSDRIVTEFEERHERPMHLIVVSNDLTDYAHLHPELVDGTWSVELPALKPGGYRVIADTVPVGGPDLVLTTDLVVPGPAEGSPLPEPAESVAVDDLEVALDLEPSADGVTARLTVTRDGVVVEPDPYLGARGHLVAIDVDDLAYLHVHPEEGTASEAVPFAIAEPSPGRYRLFFDFSVGGQVRTAAFTVDLPVAPPAPASTSDGHGHTPEDDHS